MLPITIGVKFEELLVEFDEMFDCNIKLEF